MTVKDGRPVKDVTTPRGSKLQLPLNLYKKDCPYAGVDKAGNKWQARLQMKGKACSATFEDAEAAAVWLAKHKEMKKSGTLDLADARPHAKRNAGTNCS